MARRRRRFLLATGADGADEVSDALADAGEVAVERGWWLGRAYYGFLGRRRHPVFWGLVAGSLLGVLLLWALLAALVLPGEARTVRSLGDGRPSDDDLCISGSTKLVEWAEKARHLAQLLRSIESPNASVGERLAGIQALKCATPAR